MNAVPMFTMFRALAGVVACCCLLCMGVSCDRPAERPLPTSDKGLVAEYVATASEWKDAFKASKDAFKASDVEKIDRLQTRLSKLAQRMVQRGDSAFERFARSYEALPMEKRNIFHDSRSWPFNNKKGFDYLTSRLAGGLSWEKVWISEVLGKWRYKPAAKAVAGIYRQARTQGGVDQVNILGVALVRMGNFEALLDLLARVEAKKGQLPAEFVSELGEKVVRRCAGPLIELYARTDREDPSLEVQAKTLALSFGLDWRPPHRQSQAIKLVDRWLKTDAAVEARFRSYMLLGQLAAYHEKYARAAGYYTKALEIRGGDPEALFHVANTLALAGRDKKALGVVNDLLRVDRNSARGYALRGLIRLDLGDKKGALDDINQATGLNPKDRFALISLREAYSKLGWEDKAAEIKKRLDAMKKKAPARPHRKE
jgi:tetratricopeptide (TPR) repeat protein